MTLTKADLADLLFEQVGLNKREAKDMVEAFFEEIRTALEAGDSVTLSLSNLLSHNITGATLILSSLQPGETGSACDGFTCVNFGSGNNASSVNITALLLDMQKNHVSNLIIKAGSGDILLSGLQVSTAAVPEPSSLMLMGSGLVGLMGMVRRKIRM